MMIDPDDAVHWYETTLDGAKRLAEISNKSLNDVIYNVRTIANDLDQLIYETDYPQEAVDSYAEFLDDIRYHRRNEYEYVI